ncbi:flagellar biosynthesis anti-sigma factor FlgM [Dyella sp.]|uniref:flagellar biosynthesis anti-sigma factor FlgM n=1 Tax=Dyella sp. TaxID=1869338 RepID=UPI002ED2ECF4
MNTTITSNGLPVLPQAQSSQNGASAQDASSANAKPAASAPATDSVKLTDSARALTQAAQADKSSEVNQQKVDQIRTALANGSYKPDPARIADRLISLNNQISGQ